MKLQLEIQLNLVRKLLPAGQEMKGSWNYYYLVLINIRRYKQFKVPKMGTFLQHQVCDDDCVRGKNSPLPASQTFTVEEFSYLQTSYINLKNFYQHLGSCFSWIPVGELSIIDWRQAHESNKGKQAIPSTYDCQNLKLISVHLLGPQFIVVLDMWLPADN